VVGLPLNLDGTRGAQAEKVLALVDDLRRRLDVPVVTRDERLTTVEAEERLRAAGVTGWKERKRMIDQAAAVVILQEYLDELSARPA
jgi:putative Holliday junction resolvase